MKASGHGICIEVRKMEFGPEDKQDIWTVRYRSPKTGFERTAEVNSEQEGLDLVDHWQKEDESDKNLPVEPVKNGVEKGRDRYGRQ